VTERIELSPSRSLGELAEWFRAHRDALVSQLGQTPIWTDQHREQRRELHSMDYGRESPDMRPYSEHDRSTATGKGMRWEVTLDIAYWNRAEIATASLAVFYDDAGGRRLSLTRHLRDGDRADNLDLETQGIANIEVLLDWLREALARSTLAGKALSSSTGTGPADTGVIEPDITPGDESEAVLLKESTVGRLGTVPVGCGNFWPRRYTASDGREKEGLCARLAPLSRSQVLIVGQDSAFELDGRIWRVTEIRKDGSAAGTIRLTPLPCPPPD